MNTPAVRTRFSFFTLFILAFVLVQSAFAATSPAPHKRVLFVISEYGYWGEELVGPLMALDAAGYRSDFATPKGTKPLALPPSMDPSYVDPPLGKTVTTPEMAKKTKDLEASDRLNKPINLSNWLPMRPYLSSPTYLNDLFAYNDALDKAATVVAGYDALVIVGGAGIVAAATTGNGVLIGLMVALLIVALLVAALVQAALSGIYSAALYRYAVGAGDSEGFNAQLLGQAFRTK